MNEQQRRQRWVLFIGASMVVGMSTTILALVIASPALMVLSIAFAALVGIAFFSAVLRGRGVGTSRPFPPPGTRL